MHESNGPNSISRVLFLYSLGRHIGPCYTMGCSRDPVHSRGEEKIWLGRMPLSLPTGEALLAGMIAAEQNVSWRGWRGRPVLWTAVYSDYLDRPRPVRFRSREPTQRLNEILQRRGRRSSLTIGTRWQATTASPAWSLNPVIRSLEARVSPILQPLTETHWQRPQALWREGAAFFPTRFFHFFQSSCP